MDKPSNIVKFPQGDSLIGFVANLLDLVRDGKIETIIFAGEMADGNIVTGRYDVDHATMMSLIGHLQTHAFDMRYGDGEDW